MKYIIILLCCISLSSSAQDNSIYVTGGSLLLISSAHITLESRIAPTESIGGFRAKAMVGFARILSFAGESGRTDFNLGAGFVYLLGKNKHAFEIGLGGRYFGSQERSFILPDITIGYRSEWKKVVFRVGVGIPDGIYLSLGRRF